jgi:arylsulfatase A-like enzyme
MQRPTDTPRFPVRYFLVLGTGFGLVAGFGEVALLAFKYYILGKFLIMSPHAAWMVPAVDFVLYSLLGGSLGLIHRLLPRLLTPRAAVGLLAGLTVFVWLIYFPSLHMAAALLLAIGVGVQVMRSAKGKEAPIYRMAGGAALRLTVLLLVLTAGMVVHDHLKERQALARLAAAKAGAPNVLLIILDTVRAMDLSLYGYPRPTTPNIDSWASRGVVFEQAFSTAPWTLPSHASMFTGEYPNQLRTNWETPLERDKLTLAEALSRRGYATAGFVANARYCGTETGLSRGFTHYQDYPVNLGEALKSERLTEAFHSTFARTLGLPPIRPRTAAPEITQSFLRWVDTRAPDRPFFVFLNYLDAHAPYQPAPRYRAMFERQPNAPALNVDDDRPNKVDHLALRVTPEEASTSRDLYDGAIAGLDGEIGQLLRSLESRGLLENTIVVLAADHGESFGEHGMLGHANHLYRTTTQVPLVISFPPGIPRGQRVATPVSLRNLAATISTMALGDSTLFPGRSLGQYWDHSGTPSPDPLLSHIRRLINQPDWWPASKGDMFSITAGRYRYIKNEGDGREELYDFAADPLEQHDLSATPDGQAALPALREELKHMQSQPAGR